MSGVNRFQCSGVRCQEVGMRKTRKGTGRVQAIGSDSFRTRSRARPRESEFYGGRGTRTTTKVVACRAVVIGRASVPAGFCSIKFGFLNFGHWDLFDIWDLIFVI